MRALLKYITNSDSDMRADLFDRFQYAHERRFGRTNPDRIDEPFWKSMIRSGVTGYEAMQLLEPGKTPKDRNPIWCAQRFGQSLTFLPDGQMVRSAASTRTRMIPTFASTTTWHAMEELFGFQNTATEGWTPSDRLTKRSTRIGDHCSTSSGHSAVIKNLYRQGDELFAVADPKHVPNGTTRGRRPSTGVDLQTYGEF